MDLQSNLSTQDMSIYEFQYNNNQNQETCMLPKSLSRHPKFAGLTGLDKIYLDHGEKDIAMFNYVLIKYSLDAQCPKQKEEWSSVCFEWAHIGYSTLEYLTKFFTSEWLKTAITSFATFLNQISAKAQLQSNRLNFLRQWLAIVSTSVKALGLRHENCLMNYQQRFNEYTKLIDKDWTQQLKIEADNMRMMRQEISLQSKWSSPLRFESDMKEMEQSPKRPGQRMQFPLIYDAPKRDLVNQQHKLAIQWSPESLDSLDVSSRYKLDQSKLKINRSRLESIQEQSKIVNDLIKNKIIQAQEIIKTAQELVQKQPGRYFNKM